MRIIGFIFLSITALTVSFPVFLFVSMLYVFFIPGYELIIIAALIDIFFGPTSGAVTYTIAVGGVLIGAELLRPYLSWYTARL